ncbi:MAG: ATP-binding cassette domain-containing protein [Pseudoalteromonas spongiae]
MIRVENISKTFTLTKEAKKQMKQGQVDVRQSGSQFQALRSVSFGCDKGQVLGLLGANGAGKTTTLRILASALSADSGHIYIDNDDVTHQPLLAKQHIGFLSSKTGLYNRLTAKENIEYFARLHGMNKQAVKTRCEELFEMLDMHSFLDKRAEHLSTGMKQKTNIARAVVHNPEVIVLDEPTTGLDIMTTQTVISFIQSIKAQGTPVIFSTHHLDEVELLCERVSVIDKGITCFDGTIDEFKARGQSDVLNNAFLTILKEQQGV